MIIARINDTHTAIIERRAQRSAEWRTENMPSAQSIKVKPKTQKKQIDYRVSVNEVTKRFHVHTLNGADKKELWAVLLLVTAVLCARKFGQPVIILECSLFSLIYSAPKVTIISGCFRAALLFYFCQSPHFTSGAFIKR